MATERKRRRVEYNHAYRLAHIERIREAQRVYRKRNRKKIRCYHRAWVAQNPERVKAYRASDEARRRARENYKEGCYPSLNHEQGLVDGS